MTNYNTPSGSLISSLDIFVFNYTSKGYDYNITSDGIIFKKADDIIVAKATYNECGWINGYLLV